MNSYPSICKIKISGLSLSLILSLSACSVLKSNDHQTQDNLHVLSESSDESVKANKVATDYQAIKSPEESIPKSEVQMNSEKVVNNDLPEAGLAFDTPPNEDLVLDKEATAENLKEHNAKLKEYNAKLKEHNAMLRGAMSDKQSIVAQNIKVESESEPELQLKPDATVTPVQKTTSKIDSVLDIEPNKNLTNVTIVATAEDINRLTEESPTAAGIAVESVLPKVNQEITDTPLPLKLNTIAKANEYQPKKSKYGMWQLAKTSDSRYQEVCSLSSSTVQLEDDNYTTQVWLSVIGNDLLVNSTTNIDIKKSGVGLRFDNGALQTFNKRYFQTSAVWKGDVGSALKNNKQLKISLGGNELGQRTQEVSISLKGLKGAYAEYRQCNSGVQIGSL